MQLQSKLETPLNATQVTLHAQKGTAGTTLVLGGTGKTGRRVVERLEALGLPVRAGSRSGELPFEWHDPTTWPALLQNVASVYITYYPDLAVPGAADTIRSFVEQAVQRGVRHLVLLSGRGEAEAQHCESIVQSSGVDWTILRASWFSQNFSEAFLKDLILDGVVALPTGDVQEPFISADDIADAAVAALTESGHAGQLYELTGPRLMTFAEAVAEIAKAIGREVTYVPIALADFVATLTEQGIPADFVSLLSYLFENVLDGHNAYLTDGVQRSLGRAPQDFTTYAQTTAASGVWDLETALSDDV
ncbi:MAG: NAD(P)H-binding protein [Leptolyngbya sp. SIO1D8]|nr:NAD(P)H-binding protein [Leptolyngbya sp. SIO1D8]